MGFFEPVTQSDAEFLRDEVFLRTKPRRAHSLLQPVNLLALLDATRRLESSKDYDRIYALLGVADDTSKLGIKVAYDKPLVDVYTEVMRQILLSSGLKALTIPRNDGLPTQWPSWVTIACFLKENTSPTTPEVGPLRIQQRRAVDASNSHSPRVDFDFSASGRLPFAIGNKNFKGSRVLSVPGFIVGEVSAILPVDLRAPETAPKAEEEKFNILPHAFERIRQFAANARNKIYLWWLPLLHRNPIYAPDDRKEQYNDLHPFLFRSYLAFRGYPKHYPNLTFEEAEQRRVGVRQVYQSQLSELCYNRVCFLTSAGHVGIGSKVQPGDLVVIIPNLPVPCILRPASRLGQFRFQGEAYVLGIMHGECLRMNPKFEDLEIE